jgi:hypothetical protein
MATRNEVRRRCDALRQDIRVSRDTGVLRPGQAVPSVRELAARFGLSRQVAHQEIQRLVEEGVLYTVAGSGTFVGLPPTRTDGFFLLVDLERAALQNPLSLGFATRIAALGGASLCLSPEEVTAVERAGTLPRLVGVWDSTESLADALPWGPLRREVARVGSIGHLEDPEHMDGVGVDDYDGGQQATTHLLRLGHRRIAFLGVHAGDRAAPAHSAWSERREAGWRAALEAAGLPTAGLAFHPSTALAPPEDAWQPWSLAVAARDASHPLAVRPDVTAVVAANDEAATTYVRALYELGVPLERWPALVGYDNLPNPRGQILSSLHRPLDLVGAAAAEILWDRWQGRVKGAEPLRRLVPMVLLPRVTSEAGWAARMGQAVSLLLEEGSRRQETGSRVKGRGLEIPG